MPNRVVRDELLTSERYWSVSPEARILFISLLLSADDMGRFTGANFALRTRCMAGTVSAERLEKLLGELMDVDLARVYEHENARYIFVPRFRQRLRYAHSKYPDPPSGISDITTKKTASSPPRDRLKTAEVKRSEEKRREEELRSRASPDSARQVLEFLNEKTGRHYEPVEANLRLIRARLREASADDLRSVVALKARQWKGTEMDGYLRPATLFNATKFAQYQGELLKVPDGERLP
jgi:uncharacterized phage protein (TIGR02220 family)